MNNNNIRLLIADDHLVIRRGLTLMIQNNFEIRNIFECEKSDSIVASLKENKITHAILDVTFPENPSTHFLPEIIEHSPDLRILIYTMHSVNLFENILNQNPQILFCQKSEPEFHFLKTLNKLISEEIPTPIVFTDKQKQTASILSAMEEQVLRLLLDGKSNKDISEILKIKSNTISTYKRRIMDKTDVNSIIELSKLF